MSAPPPARLSARPRSAHLRALSRVILNTNVINGLVVAFGFLLISGLLHWWLGPVAGTAGGVGVIVASVSDHPGPRRGKFVQMLPGPLLALPLFVAVQHLQGRPWELGLLLVPATFIAFCAMAWGKRGIPIAVASMMSTVFAMASPPQPDWAGALERGGWFALGAALYTVYALLAHLALNARYRSLSIVDLLSSLSTLIRIQARQFEGRDPHSDLREVPVSMQGQLLVAQAALADQLQTTRNIVFESPRTARRQRLAGMLLATLEMRDHLVASELDLESLRSLPDQVTTLARLRELFEALADDIETLGDALLLRRRPPPVEGHAAALDAIRNDPTQPMLLRGLADRLRSLNEELMTLNRLARGEQEPDVSSIRASWQLFVSPTSWSLAPFLALWRWDAPPLRHAVRASLAVALGFAISVLLPWGSHSYWILLTIVVVLRGSLAQTLERRDSRVIGTLIGCGVAMIALLMADNPLHLLLAVTIGQAIAHGFAVRRYLIASIGSTVLGLVQAHMLSAGLEPGIALVERIADTVIGAGVAWAFCYVLPSWERHQMSTLLQRVLAAQARHAKLALALAPWREIGSADDLAWRLARREAFDSLSALVQATQRSLVEPRAVRPPIEELETLQMHCYQFLAQMSAIKGMLLLRREWLKPDELEQPISEASQQIEAALMGTATTEKPSPPPAWSPQEVGNLPDPREGNLTPWLLRRLALATELAVVVARDANQVRAALSAQRI